MQAKKELETNDDYTIQFISLTYLM